MEFYSRNVLQTRYISDRALQIKEFSAYKRRFLPSFIHFRCHSIHVYLDFKDSLGRCEEGVTENKKRGKERSAENIKEKMAN